MEINLAKWIFLLICGAGFLVLSPVIVWIIKGFVSVIQAGRIIDERHQEIKQRIERGARKKVFIKLP